jgi:hypothetical protein
VAKPFAGQPAECQAEAVVRFERRARDFSPAAVRRQAQRFHARRFGEEVAAVVAGVLGTSPAAPSRQAA